MRYINCGNVYIGNIAFVLLINSDTLDRKYLKIANNSVVPPSKQEADLLNNIYQTHPKSLKSDYDDDFSFDNKNKRFKETNFKKVFIKVGSVVLSVAIAIGAGATIRDRLKLIKDQPTTSFSNYERNEQKAVSEAAKRFELAINANPNLSKEERIYIFQTIAPYANDWGDSLDIDIICALLSNFKVIYTGEKRNGAKAENFNKNIYIYNGISSFAELIANGQNKYYLNHELFHLLNDNKKYKAMDGYTYNGVTIKEYPAIASVTIEEGLTELLTAEYGLGETENYAEEVILVKLMIELFSKATILEVYRTGSWLPIFESVNALDPEYETKALELNAYLLNVHSAAKALRSAYWQSNCNIEPNMAILLNNINDIYNGLNQFKSNINNSKYATTLGSLSDAELTEFLINLATYFGCKRTFEESTANFMKIFASLYELKFNQPISSDRLVVAYFDLLRGSNDLVTNDEQKGISHKLNMKVTAVTSTYFNKDKKAAAPLPIITFVEQFPEFNNLTDDQIYELVKNDTTGKYDIKNTTTNEELSNRYYDGPVKGR
ncbi:MAG TPA: hypothetical protein PK737_02755 [Bacilli bacterium]|nr:hypothetical protein [Bacilli bacterium]